jgi:hypothetical protein
VGISTSTPLGKLQINGFTSATKPLLYLVDSTQNSNGRIFFSNQQNTGWIGLHGVSFSSNSSDHFLDIRTDSSIIATFAGNGKLGVRNLSPAYELDVNGDINLTGKLRVNGNTGLTGQYLRSNGSTTDASWADAAFGNNTRFSYLFNSFNGGRVTDSVNFGVQVYNTNTIDITKNASNSRIVFNKTGLYHLELGHYVEATFTASQNQTTISWDLILSTSANFGLVKNYVLSTLVAPPTTQFLGGGPRVSIDVYITAGTSLKLVRTFNPTPGGSIFAFSYGDFSGYLISE